MKAHLARVGLHLILALFVAVVISGAAAVPDGAPTVVLTATVAQQSASSASSASAVTTQMALPMRGHRGVNGNPWGYNYTCCQVIYHPAHAICRYFRCIPSFWHQTRGYVEQCSDGMISHSGGRRGSCSSHGGDSRPLYQP